MQNAKNQPRVVGQRIGVNHRAAEAIRREAGQALKQLLAADPAVIPDAGQKVVEPQHRRHGPAAGELSLAHQEGISLPDHQARQLAEHALPLPQRVARQAEIALRDITQAAMHHF